MALFNLRILNYYIDSGGGAGTICGMISDKEKEMNAMLSFINDYCEAAHENILSRISATSLEKHPGYGRDEICESAKNRIRSACNCPKAQIWFGIGGTQTNQLVIDTVLKPYEGVISVETGHVSVHEAGAIEFSGHKVLTVPSHNGKLLASDVEKLVEAFWSDESYESMVFPGMVYISQPTEYGTVYSKAELMQLRSVCDKYKLTLFADGARLGYALACGEADFTLADMAELTDVFYIGGTKVGALFGEAIVFTKNNMPEHFYSRAKQHGGLLAKGWLLGIQFDELFKDDLYLKISRNAIECADAIRRGLKQKGYRLLLETPTNQIFVVMENSEKEKLARKVEFGFWENLDKDHTAIRFCTSWATDPADVEKLIGIL